MPQREKARIHYVDRLRGLAVLAMFFVHPAVAWMSPEAKHSLYFSYSMQVSGIVAPVFLFLAGISVAIIADSGRARGIDARDLQWRVFKRGLQVFLIGYAFHLGTFLLNDCRGSFIHVLKVDVLQCIGVSLALFAWIAWPKRVINWAALIIFTVFPLISIATYRLPVSELLPPGVAEYFTTRGRLAQFSFVPYGAWVALGLFVGPIWTSAQREKKKESTFWCGLTVAGVVCFAIGKGIKWIYYYLALHQFGVDKPQISGLSHAFWMKAAFVLWLFAISRATAPLLDRFPTPMLVLLGKTSLFSYCVHIFIIYHIAGPLLPRKLDSLEHFTASVALSTTMFLLAYGWLLLKEREFYWPSIRARFQ